MKIKSLHHLIRNVYKVEELLEQNQELKFIFLN